MNYKRLSIFVALAMLAGLVSMGGGVRALASPILAVDRGLPTDNLNNAAGASRSNVSWAEAYDNTTGFTGDDFTVGTTGQYYTLNTITTWVVADRSVEGDGSHLGDDYSNVRLFLGTGTGDNVWPVVTGNLSTGSDATDNPNIVVTLAHYSGGLTYQGTGGTFRKMYQVDFNNLNITVQGGQTIKFGVWGQGLSDGGAGTVYAWFNHASNAALSVSPQQGFDNQYRDYSASGAFGGFENSSGNGWDKSSDLNVQVLATPAITPGTWTLYPTQATTYQTSVQQPINPDGSSIFRNNGNSVIPVKFSLLSGIGPVVFESIGSDANTANDYSYLSFTPTNPTTFNQIANLSANYAFTLGNCHGGSLRWSVRTSPTQSVFIYYGDIPNFTDCTTNSQSGTNMIGLSDLRYDTSQFAGGTFYDSYAHAQTLVGNLNVTGVSLVLDSGWGGDQRLTLTSASVNDNTWTAPSAVAPAPTCNLPQASIKVTKLSGSGAGSDLEPTTIQPADNNSLFRVVDCKYMYNLATGSLLGAGQYKVEVLIGGNPVSINPAYFTLR